MQTIGRRLASHNPATVAFVAIVGVIAGTLLLPATSFPLSDGEPVTVLAVGDTVRMKGTHVTCSVAIRGGTRVLDCVRAGAQKGSYGVRVGEKKVMVFRVKSATLGETVFSATHGERRFKTCRSGR